MNKLKPIQHITLAQAAKRLGHSRRWVSRRIKRGIFEAFKHSSNDVTISEASIIAYEEAARISSSSNWPPLFLAV